MNNTIVSTGYILPQTVISNGQTTGNAWTNPNDILLVDGDVAQSNPGANVASDIIIGNYNTNIPQNAVVTGIELKLIGYRGAQTSPAISVTPYFVDNTSGQDVFYPYVTPFTGLTETMGTYVLGTQNYLFATSFTPDQINNMKIQLVSSGDVYIDSFLVNVYYYIPGPSGSTPIPSSGCEDCNQPIQVQAMYLQLPFKIGETKFYLKPGSLTYPDGTPVQPGDVGTCGGEIDFVFDEGKAKSSGGNFEENVILDLYSAGWTVLPSGVIEVDIGSVTNRGIPFHAPFTHDPNLMSDHDANSKVVISNNAHFQGRFVRACQADSVFSVPISIKDEGVEKTPSVHSVDFVGGGVVVTVPDPVNAPNDVQITIPGVGGTTPPTVITSVSTTSGSTQVSSLSTDIDISGLNRTVVIQVSTEEVQTVSGITVGGVAATQEAVATDAGNNLRSESWVCVNPPLGTQSIVVTLSGNAYLTFGAELLNGVDTTSPVGDTATGTGSGFTPTLSLTTLNDYSVILDGLCTAQTPILYTPGAGQALNWSQVANSVTRQGGSSVEQAGLTGDVITMDYSITQNTPWAYTAIEVKGITNTISGFVQSVTDDGNGVVTVDNTDPQNPVIGFDQNQLITDLNASGALTVVTDGVTITGDGTAGNPLVAVGGGGGGQIQIGQEVYIKNGNDHGISANINTIGYVGAAIPFYNYLIVVNNQTPTVFGLDTNTNNLKPISNPLPAGVNGISVSEDGTKLYVLTITTSGANPTTTVTYVLREYDSTLTLQNTYSSGAIAIGWYRSFGGGVSTAMLNPFFVQNGKLVILNTGSSGSFSGDDYCPQFDISGGALINRTPTNILYDPDPGQPINYGYATANATHVFIQPLDSAFGAPEIPTNVSVTKYTYSALSLSTVSTHTNPYPQMSMTRFYGAHSSGYIGGFKINAAGDRINEWTDVSRASFAQLGAGVDYTTQVVGIYREYTF